MKMEFTLVQISGEEKLVIEYDKLFAIGYAGRNTKKTLAHIKELEEQLGVQPPKKIPTIFQCANYTLTQEKSFHVIGDKTSGEVEYVIVKQQNNFFIGLGSDHTDRALEGASVPKSKQICAKPITNKLWAYEDIKDHWDTIILRSEQIRDGKRFLYQEGTLQDILPLEIIIKELKERIAGIDNAIIFSGTVPLKDGFYYGDSFIATMVDEKLGRTLELNYDVLIVPEDER